jgi:hypothetical protein
LLVFQRILPRFSTDANPFVFRKRRHSTSAALSVENAFNPHEGVDGGRHHAQILVHLADKIKFRVWDSLSSRRRKLALWIFCLLFAYAVIGFFILPPIIRAVAVKQLSKQLDREVSIQKVKLNPFALSVAVRGLLIKDKDGEPFVSWDEVYVNFQLSSFLGHPWVFKEISVTGPFGRVQMNQDGTFNFSDLIAKFSATNTPAAPSKAPAKPIALWIDRLLITNATASVTDLTHRQPFKRLAGPLNFTLEHFETNPDNKNPHAFTGTTDAGEKISWNGFFYLNPLRSWGELTLENLPLNKYAPLYQDRVPLEIRDGFVGIDVNYRLEISATNRIIAVTNTSFALREFKLAEPASQTNMIELSRFAVTGVNVDAVAKQAEIGLVSADGGKFFLLRKRNDSTNGAVAVVVPPQPAEAATNAPGGIPALLGSITNAAALLLNSTNLWTATVRDVEFTNCAFSLEDLANSRPARLDLDDITLSVKNISNLPGTNLTVNLSLRWNTNGSIKTEVAASFAPPTADIQLDLDRLDFGPLDPYLEPKLNLYIPGSEFGLHGRIQLHTPAGQLPEISFQGETWLDGFRVVDGTLGEDLLKWDSVRVSGIDANVNPLSVAIKEIALNNVTASLVIETNHIINLLAALHPAGSNAPAETNAPATTNETKSIVVAKTPAATETNAPPAAPLPPITIGSIVISNAAARFTDRSLTPNVNMSVLDFGGTIAGISSTESGRADVNLNARVDGVGPVDISGHINPFSKTETKNLKVTLKDFDLTPTSPYSGKFAGYRIAQGKLNLDLAYDIVGRNLKSKNVITLDSFTFGEKVNSPVATHLPVRLAIAILKDRNSQILLDVPVEGSLDDPQFRVRKVIIHTLMNILEKAATSPFSLLGAAFGGGGEELSYQDFAPGSAVLLPADEQKLDTLAKGLYERPGLQLEIAGSIDPEADRDALRRASLDKQIRTREWTSLRKSERTATTPDQITLTPEQHAAWVKTLYDEAWDEGVINTEFITANTNLAALAAQIPSRSANTEKGATMLMQRSLSATELKSSQTADISNQTKPAAPTDPMEALLMATIPIPAGDFEALASERAKAVRAYLLQTGKVEAARLFLMENQTGGVRSDGSRAYLQFR